MKTVLPLEAARGASRSPCHWVEALVTFAIMGWFAVALVGVAAEVQGGPSAPLTAASFRQDTARTLPTTSSTDGACGTAVWRGATR